MFKIKEHWILILIFLALIVIVTSIIFMLEKNWREHDKLYKELCKENQLLIYKEHPEAPHIDSCYKIENNIITFYKLDLFENKYYLTEEEGIK